MGMARLWELNRRRRERALSEASAAGLEERPSPPASDGHGCADASLSTAPQRLRDYRTLDQVRDRLAVLYDKADRVQRFLDAGCTGSHVLDAKQAAILEATVGDVDLRFRRYFHTLRRTIDFLESRRRLLERHERRRMRRAA